MLTAAKRTVKRTARPGAPVVRRAVAGDLAGIARLVDSYQDPAKPSLQQSLARHFGVRWEGNHDFGYVLEDGRRIVGFLASLTHTRRIRGQEHTICNLSSWYVNEGYRTRSLALMREALRRNNVTFTVFSPIARTVRMLKHFDFKTLETHDRIVYPETGLYRLRPRATIWTGDVFDRLPEDVLHIYRDHQGLPCQHAVLDFNGRRCYLVLVRRSRGLRSSGRIHCVSDRPLFTQCLRIAAAQLCRQLRVTSLRIDGRLLGDGQVPFSRRRPLPAPYMFRSTLLAPEDLDGLYSELPVMGF